MDICEAGNRKSFMKRILVVHSSGKVSGGEVVSRMIFQGLKDRYQFSFFIPEIETKADFREAEKIFYPDGASFFRVVRALRRAIREERPDIIQAHGTRAALLIKVARLFNLLRSGSRGRFIYTIHGFHLAYRRGWWPRLLLFIENLTNFLLIDHIICVGEDDYQLVRKNSWSKKNISLVVNGVVAPVSAEDKELEKIRQLGGFLVLTICRLHYQKDVETLVKAVISLPPSVRLAIIGAGPQRTGLQALARGYEDRIFFLGNKPGASALLRYADLFVLSTHWEGLPLAILEAMLAGIPVIASDVPGVRELIADGQTGYLFKEGDVSELSKKIIAVQSDLDASRKIKSRALAMARSKYSVARMIEAYDRFYAQEN